MIGPDSMAPRVVVATRSLSPGERHDQARRFARAHADLRDFFEVCVVGWDTPALVWVEEPFGGGKRTTHPTLHRMFGVMLAALAGALGPGPTIELVKPGTWKMLALGAGRGSAKPEEYVAWARDVVGYRGTLEDEAAAIGVATAAGVRMAG